MKNYDELLGKIPNIGFLPYIGEKYATANPKIMVLGHSHYASENTPLEVIEKEWNVLERTREVIQEDYFNTVAEGKTDRWIRSYRYMAAVLTGKGYQNSDYIWDELIFANFFQKNVGTSPRDRQFITPELREISRNVLFKTLDILEPDIVIAWGSELYNYDLPQESEVYIDREKKFFYYETHPKFPIWGMMHPSAPAFSYDNYHEEWLIIQNLLKEYKQSI